MGQSERSLTSLGRHVAALQDQADAAQLDLERGRARLLDAAAPARPGHDGIASGQRRSAVVGPLAIRIVASLAAALLFTALAALAVVLVARPRDPMLFDLGTTEPGIVGAWIAAPPEAELPIRFSDGSLLRLAPGGRARVVSVNANGAEVALERGALALSVVHRDRARWMVRVGPFQVHVIGTRFETSWDPVTEQFGVALREGAITVSGPVVGDARAVHAGERLTVSPATNTLVVGSIDATSASAPSAVSPIAPAPPSIAPSATLRTPDAGAAPR